MSKQRCEVGKIVDMKNMGIFENPRNTKAQT